MFKIIATNIREKREQTFEVDGPPVDTNPKDILDTFNRANSKHYKNARVVEPVKYPPDPDPKQDSPAPEADAGDVTETDKVDEEKHAE